MQLTRRGRAPTGSLARETLSYLFGTRAKVGCLRVLSTVTEMITQRDVARRAGVQHRSSQIALDELHAAGVVNRVQGGRDFLVQLNRRHFLAPAIEGLFASEAEVFLALRSALVDIYADAPSSARPVSIVLFGSVARAQDVPGSDLDLLLIAPDAATVERALARSANAVDRVRERFGYVVRPIAYPLSDARRRWRRREPPFPAIIRDHIVLAGPPLRAVLDGSTGPH